MQKGLFVQLRIVAMVLQSAVIFPLPSVQIIAQDAPLPQGVEGVEEGSDDDQVQKTQRKVRFLRSANDPRYFSQRKRCTMHIAECIALARFKIRNAFRKE